MPRHSIVGTLLSFSALVAAGLTLSPAAMAELGGLLVTPTRLVLEGTQRSSVLTLTNRGKEATTYRISVNMRRMTEDGKLDIDETGTPNEVQATKMVRFSPREVTLPPGVTQNVRIQIRKPAALADGEYRCHFLFLEVPPPETARTNLSALSNAKHTDITFQITQLYGVSIPLIFRQGDMSATLGLSDLKLVANPKPEGHAALTLALNRTGNRSVYGECNVTFVGADGAEKIVSSPTIMAVYPPLATRKAEIPLSVAARDLKHGRLKVSFKETSPPAKEPMAVAELRLP